MIQRIQSIFLFYSSVLQSIFMFTTLYLISFDDKLIILKPLNLILYSGYDFIKYIWFPYFIIGILSILSAIISFVTIFLYNNRAIQIFLLNITFIIFLFILVLSIFFIYKIQIQAKRFEISQIENGFILFSVSFLSNLFAKKYIIKDENLVRSANRLR